MDLLDYVNPVKKTVIGTNDRMLVTDGNDIFTIPPENVQSYNPVDNVLGGMVAADDANDTGKISVEDLVVAMVALKYAVNGSQNADFENVYTSKFNYASVKQKLFEQHLIPLDICLENANITIDKDADEKYEVSFDFLINENGTPIDLNKQSWEASLSVFEREDGKWQEIETLSSEDLDLNPTGEDRKLLSGAFDPTDAIKETDMIKVVVHRGSIGLFYDGLDMERKVVVEE